jgi:hypothetical protein
MFKKYFKNLIFLKIYFIFFFFISTFFLYSCLLNPKNISSNPQKYLNNKIKFEALIEKQILTESPYYYIYEVIDKNGKDENIKYKFFLLTNQEYKKGDIIQIQGKIILINENNLKNENFLKDEINFFILKFTNISPNISYFYNSKIYSFLEKIYNSFKDFFLIISYGNYKVNKE